MAEKVIVAVCIAAAVWFIFSAISCATVTVQTSTGAGTVSHDADKGAIILKPHKGSSE